MTFIKGLFRSRKIALWEGLGALGINFLGAFLHFAFELTNFWRPIALIASVNESTWEHLKFYFWSGVIFALIEYTYVKDDARNFLYAKALSLLVTPIVIAGLFYGYLAIALPIYGGGFLWADIGTGVVGVIIGQMVSSYIMQREKLPAKTTRYGAAILASMMVMFSLFTYFPPKMFLFENYWGYEYSGEYGILEDYEPYLFFTRDE